MPIYISNIKVRYKSINEILTIKRILKSHWPRAIFGHNNLRARFFPVCSFCRMLKDHKNFRFTAIPDKTNDFIFLKSPKKPCFWPFLIIFDINFPQKNSVLSHITKYVPLTPSYVSEKTNKPILRKLKSRRGGMGGRGRLTIGRMDRQKDRPSFTGPFWPCPGVQQEKPQKKSQIKHCLTTLNTARAICWK